MGLSTVTNKLATQTVSASFDQLLYLDHAAGMVDSTLKIVSTDTGHSALQITNDQVLVLDKSGTDIASLFEVQDKDANVILSVNGTNNSVGIGEAVPGQKLVVADASSPNILIQRYTNASQGAVDDEVLGRLQFGAQDSTGSAVQPGVGAHIYAEATAAWDNDDVDDCPTKLVFGTSENGATSSGIMGPGSGIGGHSVIDRMTILADGKIGIGTDTPAVLLDIEDHTASSASQGGNLRLGSDDGAVMASGHRLGVIEFAGAESAESTGGARDGTITVGARIEAVTDATWSASENGASLDFYTTDGNAVQTQRMTILADGNVGIGATGETTSTSSQNLAIGDRTRLSNYTDYYGYLSNNAYMSGTDTFKYIENGYAAQLHMSSYHGWMQLSVAASGSADGTITWIDALTVIADGKVGIGIASPNHQFAIENTSANGGGVIGLSASDTTAPADGDILGIITFLGRDSDTYAEGAAIKVIADGTWGDLSADDDDAPSRIEFHTQSDGTGDKGTNSRMVLDSAGNLALGDNLYPQTNDAVSQNISVGDRTRLSNYTGFYGYLSQNAYLTDTDTFKYIENGFATQLHMSSYHGWMQLSTSVTESADATISWIDAVTILATGKVGIGKAAPDSQLEVVANIAGDYAVSAFNDGDNANRLVYGAYGGADDGTGTTYYVGCYDGDGGAVGYLQNAGETFSAADVSDVRLKKDIVDTSINGLNSVNAMKVRDFKWKKSGNFCSAGFIANELKEAFTPAVFGEPDAMESYEAEYDEDGNITKEAGERIDPMTISRDRLVPVLVKAIQELSAEVEKLKSGGDA